jgi:hypothetical protein
MADEIRDQIIENAQAPKSIETDGLRVTEHSLRDQIEAAKFQAKSANASQGKLGIRVGRFKPGGAAH